ncbi:unnamed protein product [Taenia asiatica]|uniref:Rho-related GTP-binding protein RhoU n=1 Tax=Taenia asiatica TaxID=60517 RepID=A0A0R3VUZ5_TAEAS|nr:unnamed protein product [Taenia asiatica]
MPPVIKCVFIGDGAVGKTCLLMKKATGSFPRSYVPTVFDNYTMPVEVKKTKYQFSLVDTAGQEEYEALRRQNYHDASVFVLCFAVDLRSSFSNVATKWVEDIRAVCATTPILLVGCKSDVRANSGLNSVTYREGKNLAKEVGAVQYVECSALTNAGLDDVFAKAALIGAGFVNKKRSRCSIM